MMTAEMPGNCQPFDMTWLQNVSQSALTPNDDAAEKASVRRKK
jgi:hypothetical protein